MKSPNTYEFSEDVRDLHAQALRVVDAFRADPQPEFFTQLEKVSQKLTKTARLHPVDCIGVVSVAPEGEVETAVVAGFAAALLHATLESDPKSAALSVFSCLAGTTDAANEFVELIDLWAGEEQVVVSWEATRCIETADWAIYGPSAMMRPESALAATSRAYANLRSENDSPDEVFGVLAGKGPEFAKSCAFLLQATLGYLAPFTGVMLESGEVALVLETGSFLEVSRPIGAVVTDESGTQIGAKIRRLGSGKRQVSGVLEDEPAYLNAVRRKYQTEQENADWTASRSVSIHESVKTLQGGFGSASTAD